MADFLEGEATIFDLFDTERPFWQDPRANRLRPVSDLIHEIPAATNFWHFRHATVFIDGICPACCVKGLLRLPLFTTIGGAGIGAGINGTPPFYVAPWGNTLGEQLWQNWHPEEHPGTPSWDSSATLNFEEDIPLLVGLTWQPRKVLFQIPTGEKSTCIACGAQNTDIVYYAQLQAISAPKDVVWNDPHVVKGDTGKLITSSVAIMSSEKVAFTGRDWQKILAAYLNTRDTSDPVSQVHLVGFTTNQAKYIDVWEHTVDLPFSGIREESLIRMSNWSKSLIRARRRKKPNASKPRDIPTFADIIPHVESGLAERAGELAGACEFGWDNTEQSFGPLFSVSARSLYPDTTVKALIERKRLSNRTPNVITEATKGTKKKQIGEQDE